LFVSLFVSLYCYRFLNGGKG